jgi:hypothetical protein
MIPSHPPSAESSNAIRRRVGFESRHNRFRIRFGFVGGPMSGMVRRMEPNLRKLA